jgi:hypothetical protein
MANISLSFQKKNFLPLSTCLTLVLLTLIKIIIIQTVLGFLGIKSRYAIYKCSPNSLIVNNLIYRDMPDSRPLALLPVSRQDCRRGGPRQGPGAAPERVQGRPQTGSCRAAPQTRSRGGHLQGPGAAQESPGVAPQTRSRGGPTDKVQGQPQKGSWGGPRQGPGAAPEGVQGRPQTGSRGGPRQCPGAAPERVQGRSHRQGPGAAPEKGPGV